MVNVEVEDLFHIAQKISFQYQNFLKEGRTKENQSKLRELLQHEQFLYDLIELEDYHKYCLELQNNFFKSKSSIYSNMYNGNFVYEKRVLNRFFFLQESKSVKDENIAFPNPDFRFGYGIYFEFFNYLQIMYRAYMSENPNYIFYFYKSLVSLGYTYPYLEQSYLLNNKKYQYFCKQDFESILGVNSFSSLKDQLYQHLYTLIHSFSQESKNFLTIMLENGLNLYSKRKQLLEVQEEYPKNSRS